MKWQINTFRIGFLSLLFFLITSSTNHSIVHSEKEEFTSIQKLITSEQVEAEITGIGGHQAHCIEFNLKNLTADSLNVFLEAGRRLTSVDSSIQDIFIVKDEKFQLGPYEEYVFSGNGYCCQSKNSSPRLKSEFNIGYMAPDSWLSLAEVIDKNNFPANAIQSAVWVLSDNHEISSIHHDNLKAILPLRQVVADIKGETLPWYTLTYEKDSASLFTNKPDKLYCDISYYLNTNSAITIVIRNAKGEHIYTVANRLNPGRGKHAFELKLPVNSWAKGDYALCIYEDFNNLNTKKVFTL